MADDSAQLVVDGQSRRVAMDITKLDTENGSGETEIEGEVHDQEDLNGVKDAILKIDGTGEFKVNFYSATRFRGAFVPPEGHEAN